MTRLLCIAVVVMALACAHAAEPKLDDAFAWSSANVDEGRRLYRALCAGCHGRDGDGKSPAAALMFPPPRDLRVGAYRFRSTTDDLLPLRSDLVRTIERGLPGTAMPSWGQQLSGHQIRSLVLYLETLSPRFADEPPAPDEVLVDLATVEPPPRTADLLARGRKVYERMNCGECHGASGRGDGPAAPTLRNRDGERADLFDFTSGDYKGGSSPAEVYRTFMTGLEGTPMPSFADALPDETDRWALVYYCLSLGRDRGVWFYLSERPTWREPILE